MATGTANYNLTKPGTSDTADITVVDSDLDSIDSIMKTNEKNGIPYGTDTSSTANTITVAVTPTPTAYVDGYSVRVKVANTTTGATMLNVNGLGAVTVKNSDGSAVGSGDLQAGTPCIFTYVAGSPAAFIASGSGIPSSEKGAANGVATLDGNSKVIGSQLPIATTSSAGVVKGSSSVSVATDGTLSATALSVGAVPTSAEGVANGVATLDGNTRLVQTANNSLKWNGVNVTVSSTAPSSPAAGDEWYNTSTNRKLYWNGSAWVDPLKYQ